MIIDMPNTRTREIAHKIEQLHEERGESATGRVLTLLIATEDADLEHALEIANSASREHPCRVIAVVPDTNPADQSGEGEPNAAEVAAEVSASRDNPAVDLTDGPNDPNDSNLNAQVRFGADAGAGEIIVLRHYRRIRHKQRDNQRIRVVDKATARTQDDDLTGTGVRAASLRIVSLALYS